MTIEEFLQEIITVFKKVGIENPKLEAELLACHVLSCTRSHLLVAQNEEIPDKVLLASAALINERCKRRPLQYVIGKTEFYGMDIAVDERVLIPRPETEELVQAALEDMKEKNAPSVLDLCTGSGCIAIAVAANKKDAAVTASDFSIKAYQLARVNARPYENIKVVRGDLFHELGSFDYILTNPPYIPSATIKKLQTEVKDFEPAMALDGGKDGLDIIKRIIDEAPLHLNEGGQIFMEIGDDQGEALLRLANESGQYKDCRIIKDINGQDRIFRATKK